MNPVIKKYNSAETLKLFEGMSLNILLSGKDTGGLIAVFEDIVETGVGPGRHIHLKQDETFLFLEGTFEVEIDGEKHEMTVGDTAFIPKGTPHSWKNIGEGKGKLRYIFSPALNIEQMFREISSANKKGGFTPELIQRLAQNYPEQVTVGPPM